MKTALIPGSFDPPTYGHLDIIQRAAKLFDKLYICIAINNAKYALFSLEEKKEMLQEITRSLSNVEIVSYSGLTVEFAKQKKVDFLVRGLRAFSDFESEFRMALANRKISGMETLFLMADEKHAHISSSLIREIGRHGKHLSDFVPAAIEDKIFEKLQH